MKLILILAVLFASTIGIAAANYDFIYMVMQWSTSFCSSPNINCARPAVNYFTIHGLWPQMNNAKAPVNCAGPNLAVQALKDKKNSLLNQLDIFWLDLTNSTSNLGFWKSEWNKHGKCSPLSIDIRNVIFKEWNVVPDIQCNRNKTGNIQLYQIIFRMDKKGALQNCVYKGCGNNIQISFPVVKV